MAELAIVSLKENPVRKGNFVDRQDSKEFWKGSCCCTVEVEQMPVRLKLDNKLSLSPSRKDRKVSFTLKQAN